jgi:hypothetical protein
VHALSGKVPCVTYSNLHFTDRREVLLVPSLRDRKNFRRVQHRPDFVGQVPDPLFRLSATSVTDRLGQAIDLGQCMFRCSKILANAAKIFGSSGQRSVWPQTETVELRPLAPSSFL